MYATGRPTGTAAAAGPCGPGTSTQQLTEGAVIVRRYDHGDAGHRRREPAVGAGDDPARLPGVLILRLGDQGSAP